MSKRFSFGGMGSAFVLAILFHAPLVQAAGGIGAQDCPSYDNESHFGPGHDQRSGGQDSEICWAIGGASLLEEDACLSDSANCGKSASAMSVARCSLKSLSTLGNGGTVGEALRCGFQGYCLEKDPGPVIYDVQKVEQVQHFFSNWHSTSVAVCDPWSDDGSPKTSVIIGLVRDTTEPFINLIVGENGACRQQDIIRPGTSRSVGSVNFIGIHRQIQPSDLVPVFKKNRSVALEICVTPDGGTSEYTGYSCQNDGTTHALIVDGMKWNGKSCQVHIRNSYGKDHPTGWSSFSTIQPAAAMVWINAQ